MKILGVIPARGGSKGVPRKNLKLLAGKPLIGYTIEACKRSSLLERTIISTDDIEIAEFGKREGMEVPFLRSPELAEDNSSMIDVVKDALIQLQKHDNYKPDLVVLLQPTSPFRNF